MRPISSFWQRLTAHAWPVALQVVHRPGKRASRPGLAKFTVLTKTGGVPLEQPLPEPAPASAAGKAGSRPGTGSAVRPTTPAKSAAAAAKEAKEAAAREAAAKEAAAAAAAAAPVLTPVEYVAKSRWLIPAHGSVELLVQVRPGGQCSSLLYVLLGVCCCGCLC